jgi:hypothetical protein
MQTVTNSQDDQASINFSDTPEKEKSSISGSSLDLSSSEARRLLAKIDFR